MQTVFYDDESLEPVLGAAASSIFLAGVAVHDTLDATVDAAIALAARLAPDTAAKRSS